MAGQVACSFLGELVAFVGLSLSDHCELKLYKYYIWKALRPVSGML